MYRDFDLYELNKEDDASAAPKTTRKFAPARFRPTVRRAVPPSQAPQGNAVLATAVESSVIQDGSAPQESTPALESQAQPSPAIEAQQSQAQPLPQNAVDQVEQLPDELTHSANATQDAGVPVAVHEEARVQTEISQDENIAAARESPDELATQNPTSMQGDETLSVCEPAQEESAHALPPQCPPNDPSTPLQHATLDATPSAACPPDPTLGTGSPRDSRNKKASVKPSGHATPFEPTGRVSQPYSKGSASDAPRHSRRKGGPSAGKKNPNVELMAREDMTMSDFVWKIQQQEKELVRKERAAKLEASRRCLPGGSSDSAATTVQPPVAPKHLTGGPPAHMVVRDNGDIEIETNDIMLDAHEEVDYVEEHGPALVNSGSFINRISCHRWSHIETSMFYRALAVFGQDYSMMGRFFPGRERKHLKNKFKAEEKANPDRVADTLRLHVHIGPQCAGPLLLEAAEVIQDRAEIGPIEDNGADVSRQLRDILMGDLPGLPDISPSSPVPKKQSKRREATQALPPDPTIPLLELPSWPPKEKRPRRACVKRATYNPTFPDGSESDTTIQNSPVVPKKKRRRSLSARYKDYIT